MSSRREESNGGGGDVRLRSIGVGVAASSPVDDYGEDANGGGGGEAMDEEAAARFWGVPRFGASRYGTDPPPYDDEEGEGGYDLKDNGGGRGDDETGSTEMDESELFEPEREPLTLPESTHSIFFTQPFCSVPFFFALCITGICVASLSMAMINALEEGSSGNPLNVPANVSTSVKIAQYLAVFIALLMEEEIPTAVQLLRVIPQASFKKRFPSKSYKLFVAAALLRIALGYLFLINVYLTLVQSTGVLDIFFDVLALQFISELDDIAFSLCKMEVLGKRMFRACSAKLFQTEFEKQKMRRALCASIFLKSVYFVNLAAFIVGMTIVTDRQQTGHYQCQEITVDFGDAVWADPVVLNPWVEGEECSVDDLSTLPPECFLQGYTMVFSYFNGVYKQLDKETNNGRPVYTEMKKFDSEEFDEEGVWLPRPPSKIKYSRDSDAWIFVNPFIRRSKGKDDSSDEPWLLRSPETDGYELTEVSGLEWNLWLGRIESSRVKIACNTCSEDADCNLNGQCLEDGTCKCNENDDVNFLGTHCQIKLEKNCQTIESEVPYAFDENMTQNIKYSVSAYSKTFDGTPDTLFQEYSRPVYSYVDGLPGIREGDIIWLVFTGRRWFGMYFNMIDLNATIEEVIMGTINFHAFWSNAYSTSTTFVSDPTTGDNPVGVDFYYKGEVNSEENNQFGPFGALYSAQKDGQVGRGFWHCAGPTTDLFGGPSQNTTNTTRI